jgi:hypothetical protein
MKAAKNFAWSKYSVRFILESSRRRVTTYSLILHGRHTEGTSCTIDSESFIGSSLVNQFIQFCYGSLVGSRECRLGPRQSHTLP